MVAGRLLMPDIGAGALTCRVSRACSSSIGLCILQMLSQVMASLAR